jgi:hypothetical protein
LRNVLRVMFLAGELIEPLSVKLIKRTLQEFEAHVNAHESRLWVVLMFGYDILKKSGDHITIDGSAILTNGATSPDSQAIVGSGVVVGGSMSDPRLTLEW